MSLWVIPIECRSLSPENIPNITCLIDSMQWLFGEHGLASNVGSLMNIYGLTLNSQTV
jgi:hypothetical protein